MEAFFEGREFANFEEFSNALTTYQNQQHVVFTRRSSRKVESGNRVIGPHVTQYEDKFVYAYIRYGCKHNGKRRDKGKAVRARNCSYRMECPAKFSMSVDRKKDRLVMSKVILEHNHELSSDRYNKYPEVRRVSPQVQKAVERLLDLNVKAAKIKEHVRTVYGNQITTKDVHNLKFRTGRTTTVRPIKGPVKPKISFSQYHSSESDSESEHTNYANEEIIQNYTLPTEEELTKLGYSPSSHDAKFSVLCHRIGRKSSLVAMRREIPPSEVVYHFEQSPRGDVEFSRHGGIDDVLKSRLCQDLVEFYQACGQDLVVDTKNGRFKGKTLTSVDAVRGMLPDENSIFDDSLGQIENEYSWIREAMENGWKSVDGREALVHMMRRAIQVCNNYAKTNSIQIPKHLQLCCPIRATNIGQSTDPEYPGNCTLNYQHPRYPMDDLHAYDLKFTEHRWDGFHPVGSKVYVPDAQVFRNRSEYDGRSYEVLMSGVVTSFPGAKRVDEAKKQALIGLQYHNITYVIIMSVFNATLVKMEITDGGRIASYEKRYNFRLARGKLFNGEEFGEVFLDFVRIMWESYFKEAV